MNKNIEYKSEEILKFYSSNRIKWDEFYPSERWVFERVSEEKKSLGDVLDVGCACGGLGAALCEKSLVKSYTGVDIHKASIDWAGASRKLKVKSNFIYADIVTSEFGDIFDTVISLGCADWNIETKKIIDACWKNVLPGGYFIVSIRLTTKPGVNDIKRSYQLINFSGSKEKPERANYAVLNFDEALKIFKSLLPRPDLIGVYGYWGKPSKTAVTPFNKLGFSVFYIRKSRGNKTDKLKKEINLPDEFVKKMEAKDA